MKFQHGDFVKSDEMESLILENNGSFIRDCQFMTFDYMGMEVVVGFELTVSGTHSFDPGDYYTPPYSECDIDDIDVYITDLYVDEYEVELTKEIKDILMKIINKNL